MRTILSQPDDPQLPANSIDAVLLSHDQHEDNLDAAGRSLLDEAGLVITTVAGAGRLGGGAVGLAPCLTAADDSGYEIDEAEVVYWGRCPDCVAAGATRSSAPNQSE